MTEEKTENKDLEKECYCIDKKETCKFVKSILASFLGTLLALAIFTTIYKPPVPPAPPIGPQWGTNRPCPCGIINKRGHNFHKRGPQHHRCHKQGRGQGEFKGKPLPHGKLRPIPPKPEAWGKIKPQGPLPNPKP